MAKPLVLEPSLFGVEIAVVKLKIYKSPGTDQIPIELIKAVGEILRLRYTNIFAVCRIGGIATAVEGIHFLPTHKEVNKTDCNNYPEISIVSTAYKMLPSIFMDSLI
jgi:hypothetical protein